MKRPILYTLATVGVAGVSCLAILASAGTEAQTRAEVSESSKGWDIGGLLAQLQVLQPKPERESPTPEPISTRQWLDAVPEPLPAETTNDRRDSDTPRRRDQPLWINPENVSNGTNVVAVSKSNYGGGSSANTHASSKLTNFFNKGYQSSGGGGSSSGSDPFASGYKDQLISSLLRSLDQTQIDQLLKNQQKREEETSP